ncbi:MAG: hypothetical protein JOZ46_07495 [Candidatus Dormibacteraeota bacterium]|nr:hypothetical protein [Candidatus Dormibacteraeota bacterium]MBV9525642.1 hypothetical protein [Candidatus Dormibacteraeota bacterium]
MATLHQKLTVAIVLAALGGSIWSGYIAYKDRLSPNLRLAGWVMVVALLLQGVSGAVLALGGQHPAEPLHLVVGPLTLLALPVALLAGGGRSPRAEGLIAFAGWLVTFGLSLRAAGTGGLTA